MMNKQGIPYGQINQNQILENIGYSAFFLNTKEQKATLNILQRNH
jgi:hypothetical protein